MENNTQEPGDDYNGTQVPPIKPPKPSNRLAAASMIVSISALVCCCIPILQFILAMAGIVLAIISREDKRFTGQAVTGLVLSIISLITSLIVFASVVFTYQMLRDPEMGPMYNQIYQEMLNYWEQAGIPAN